MGNKLFGLDIAKIINTAMSDAGGVQDLTLIKVTPGARTSGSLTAGTNSTEASYAGKGFEKGTNSTEAGTTTTATVLTVSILGASIASGAAPEVHDKVTINGTTRIIWAVDFDPALAVYTCQVG